MFLKWESCVGFFDLKFKKVKLRSSNRWWYSDWKILQETSYQASKRFFVFFFSEQSEEESVLGVSIWLKLSEIMSSPPLHLTIPPPPALTSPLYWLALLHHTGDPVERIFSLYKEKMQLGRLWDDRKDLPRASLPLTSDGHPGCFSTKIIWRATENIYLVDWEISEWHGNSQFILSECLSHPTAECEHLFVPHSEL